jgi:hypothetical protein
MQLVMTLRTDGLLGHGDGFPPTPRPTAAGFALLVA